jgi:hypothetical protein
MGNKLGAIDRGRLADLFVVRGNPLQDIKNTRNIEIVIKSGTVYDPKALLESAKDILGPKTPEEADWWKGNVRFK